MEKVKISDFAEVITGGTPSTTKKEYWENGNIPWLQSGVCQNCDVNECDTFINELGLKNSSAKLMPKDTVLIALTGSTTGKVAYLNFEACANQSVTGILPNKTFKQRYIYYYLLSMREKILFDSYGGAQKHISQGYVKNMEIPIKTIQEQEKIINNLNIITESIEIRKKQLEELDNLVKSLFVEMFGNVQSKIFLDEITHRITDGSHNPPKGIEKSDYLMLSSQNVHNKLDLTDVRYLKKEDFEIENKRTNIEEGDILLTIVGTIGRTHVVQLNEKYVFQRSVAVIKPKKELLNSVFLSMFLQTDDAKEQFNKCGHGSSQKGIYLQDLKKLKIPQVSLEEQIKFSQIVKLIDKQKFEIQKSLEEMEELKESLMNTYFG